MTNCYDDEFVVKDEYPTNTDANYDDKDKDVSCLLQKNRYLN